MGPKKKKGKKDANKAKEQRLAEERAKRERELQEQRNRELLEQFFEKEQARLQEERVEMERIAATKAGELAIMLGKIQRDAEWKRFMECETLPPPQSERDVNTYLSLWAEEKINVEEEPSLVPLFNQLPSAESLEIERAFAIDNRDAKNWARLHEHMTRLIEILNGKWNSVSQQILQNFQLESMTDNFSFGIWGNLTRNPRHKNIEFPQLNMSASLPKPLVLSNVTIRMLYMTGANCGVPFEVQEGEGHRSFVGGVLMLDLAEMPDPPKIVDNWTIRQILSPSGELKRLDYPFKKAAAEVAEEENENSNDAHMWSTLISFPIPSHIFLDSDSVKVMYWNAEQKMWDDEGITDDDIDLEAGRVKCRTSHFGPTAVVQVNTYAEFPYRDWILEPIELNRGLLRIYGRKNELHLDIREGECQVVFCGTEYVPKPFRNKWFPPSLLLKACVFGLNFRGRQTMKGVEMEEWILKAEWKSLVFDVNYRVKDEGHAVGFVVADNNVTDETKFKIDNTEGSMLQASCFHLLRPQIRSPEGSAKVEQCSAHFTRTVAQVLAATRVLCFSTAAPDHSQRPDVGRHQRQLSQPQILGESCPPALPGQHDPPPRHHVPQRPFVKSASLTQNPPALSITADPGSLAGPASHRASIGGAHSFGALAAARASSSAASSAASSPAVSPLGAHAVKLIEKPLASNKFAASPLFSALRELAAAEPLPFPSDAAWLRALRSPIPSVLTIQDSFDLDCAGQPAGEAMVANQSTTGNFNTLVLYLLTQLRRMRLLAYEGEWPQEAHNALFGVRIFTKYFVESTSKQQLFEIFEHNRAGSPVHDEVPRSSTPSQSVDSGSASTQANSTLQIMPIDAWVATDKRKRSLALLEELLHVVIYANTTTAANYEFYVDAINLLLVLLSGQLARSAIEPADNDHFMVTLMDNLGQVPACMLYSAYSMLFAPKDDPAKTSPVADKSLMLLLVLTGQAPHAYPNNFREALSGLIDSGGVTAAPSTIISEIATNPLQMPFRDIYQAVIIHMRKDETSLLLYVLLLKNREFRMYVMSRTDPEGLLLPLLRLIYEFVERKSSYSQLYILLTVLLILSQDDVYNENNHKVVIAPPTWFTERIIRSMTLGGLVVLVLVRAVQANLSRHKDIYFHTTSLAILANMSSTIVNIHSVVAQRLIKYDLAKRFVKLSKRAAALGSLDSPVLASDTTSVEGQDHEHIQDGDLDAELAVTGDLVALLLEIINSVLTHTLKSNPQLVYAILHRRDMFAQFRTHHRFSDLIENIDTVISHFHGRLTEADLRTPSVDDILKLIDATAKRWTPERLKLFPEVKFQYEEAEYQRFFVPYVWSLVYQHSLIFWSISKAQLLRELDPDFPLSDFTVPL
nr:hypothetical protein HK105_006145 [Polyrhizophydium stewartii]